MKMRSLIWFVLFTVILAGCKEDETEDFDGLNSENIYFDYVIKGEESGEYVVSRFQFRLGGPDGDPVLLKDTSRIELDGQVLTVDSTRFNGYYYESVQLLETFKGKHSIIFTAADGRQYKEEFEFIPFRIENEIPVKLKRDDHIIRLKDFPVEPTQLRLVMTDTAFGTSWINKKINVENREVHITRELVSRLKSGPIGFELHREEKRKFKNRTKKGGKFIIYYSLKRELELID